MTAHDAMFTQAGLQMGERVLIHAVGSGVGTAAVQLARAAGATTYGTSRTPAKLEAAQALGLNVGLSDQGFAAEIMRLTNGEGVHVVIDFVGAPYLEQNLQAMANWGRIVYLSTMGGAHADVNLGILMQKRISMRGVTLRNRIAHHEPIIAWDLPKHYRRMIEMTGWLCPAAADWCEAHSRFLEAYAPERIVFCSEEGPEG